jgi:hypothetical protein
MAKLDAGFDQNNVPEGDKDFAPIPAGMYKARVIESNEYENKKRTGRIIELVWQIDGPTHANRRIWQQINYIHKNSTTQGIGQREIKEVGQAVGVWPVGDTGDLHGKPCSVRVTVKNDPGYEPSNEIKKVKALSNPKPGQKPKRQQAQEDYSDEGGFEPDLDDEIPF